MLSVIIKKRHLRDNADAFFVLMVTLIAECLNFSCGGR